MTARRTIIRLVVIAAAFVAAVCLCRDVRRIADVFGRRQNAEFADAFRAFAAQMYSVFRANVNMRWLAKA